MTLQDYEAKIERLEKLDVGPMTYDGYDKPDYESPAEQAAEILASVAREIRGIAWSGPFQPWARELTARAIASADRIARENGRLGGYAARLPF